MPQDILIAAMLQQENFATVQYGIRDTWVDEAVQVLLEKYLQKLSPVVFPSPCKVSKAFINNYVHDNSCTYKIILPEVS